MLCLSPPAEMFSGLISKMFKDIPSFLIQSATSLEEDEAMDKQSGDHQELPTQRLRYMKTCRYDLKFLMHLIVLIKILIIFLFLFSICVIFIFVLFVSVWIIAIIIVIVVVIGIIGIIWIIGFIWIIDII